MMNTKSIVVLHPFQQHSFRTAAAIKQAGMLGKYITTVYNKKGSWTNRFQFMLSANDRVRSEKRKTQELFDEEVLQFCEIRALLLLLLQRIDKSKKLYNWCFQYVIKVFNKKVFTYLEKVNPDAIIVYDTMSADLMEQIKKRELNIKIILDMSAPYYNFMEKEFLKDRERNPDYSDEMISMLNSSIYSYRRKYSQIEIQLADAFIVASEFTKRSLVECGVNRSIYICPYGVDDFIDITRKFTRTKKQVNWPLKALYVGRVNQAKGAYLLLDIASKFNPDDIIFDFYGTYNATSKMVCQSPSNCVFHGHVPRSKMIEAYKNADILILPTLADGFGFVIPEALSFGVPVIVSNNAGAAQIIQNGVNGFTFEVGNKNALFEIIQTIIYQPELVDTMRENSFNSVRKLSWSNYNQHIVEAINDFFKN